MNVSTTRNPFASSTLGSARTLGTGFCWCDPSSAITSNVMQHAPENSQRRSSGWFLAPKSGQDGAWIDPPAEDDSPTRPIDLAALAREAEAMDGVADRDPLAVTAEIP